MQKIGSFLREERVNRGYTLAYMEKQTKIKRDFIDGIERGNWDLLPEYPVVLGFVKTLAKNLDLPQDKITALLRRDYPPSEKKLRINPIPDLKIYKTINPKILTIAALIVMALGILGYLFYQYKIYVSPPVLIVYQPEENETIETDQLPISGKTNPDATLIVNNQHILVSESGNFVDKIEIDQNTKVVTFVARSKYGKEVVVERNIVPKLE